MTEDPVKKIWNYRIEIFSGCLLLIGLILSFFYIHVGEALVGLGVGLCFYEEMHNYFVQVRELYVAHGLFKTLVLIGLIVFLLITIPLFVVAIAVGYGAMYLVTYLTSK